jgi:hypothetical protein
MFLALIAVSNQLVGAYEGQQIKLECHSEAYPKSINYWTKEKGDIVPQGELRFMEDWRKIGGSYQVYLNGILEGRSFLRLVDGLADSLSNGLTKTLANCLAGTLALKVLMKSNQFACFFFPSIQNQSSFTQHNQANNPACSPHQNFQSCKHF